MKKIFTIALITVVAAFTASVSKADLSLSGYQEFYGVSVDQSTTAGFDQATTTPNSRSGLSNGRFTRLIATATTTLDSGIDVTGVYSIAKDGGGTADAGTQQVAVNENSITLGGGFGNISIGNIFSAGTMIHNRGTTLIPTAEPDNGVVGTGAGTGYATAGGATGGYGAFDEAGYALDDMKIRYMSNVMSGFQVAVSYSSCLEKGSQNASDVSCSDESAGTVTNYDDVIDVGLGYSMDFEGVNINLTYGMVSGNSQILDGSEYNDLEAQVYSASLSAHGVQVVYKNHTYADSGQLKSRTVDGDGEGSVYAVRYDMGNIGVGYIHTETQFREGTNSADSTQEIDIFGVSYNLGGGVVLEAAHGSIEEVDGSDSLKDTEADISLVKISFGF